MMRSGLWIASSLLLALTRAESKSQDYCGYFGAKYHFLCSRVGEDLLQVSARASAECANLHGGFSSFR